MTTPMPKRRPSRQERLATWASCGAFFSSCVPLLVEREAFDNTLGEMWLVSLGVASALLLAIPGSIAIRRMDFASRDRWAACIFLVLGLCGWGVPAATWVNHRFPAAPPHDEALPVLEKKYVSPGRNSNGPQYWLRLAYHGKQKWITVDDDGFDRAREGKPYEVDVVQGALGLPVIGCAWCMSPTPWITTAATGCATSRTRRAVRLGCTSTSRSATVTSTWMSSSPASPRCGDPGFEGRRPRRRSR